MFRQERIELRGVRFNEAVVRNAICDSFQKEIVSVPIIVTRPSKFDISELDIFVPAYVCVKRNKFQ